MPPRVKICGLCRPPDVKAAIDAGADFLGFVLYEKSPRHVDLETLSALTEHIPAGILKVGVVVNAAPATIAAAVKAGGLDVIQFHGDESAGALDRFGLTPCWKAVALRHPRDLEMATQCPADRVLVDSISANARGGTGQCCNWDLAAELAGRRPIILAGGLRPENVAEAVRAVHPWALDVSSGVERRPGVKDHAAIRALIEQVRRGAD